MRQGRLHGSGLRRYGQDDDVLGTADRARDKIHGRIRTPDPAAVARFQAMVAQEQAAKAAAQQRQRDILKARLAARKTPTSLPTHEDEGAGDQENDEMPSRTPILTEDEVRTIYGRAVAGETLPDAVAAVVGDRIKPNSIYPYLNRLGLPSVKEARKAAAAAQDVVQPSVGQHPVGAPTPEPTPQPEQPEVETAVVVQPEPETAVAPAATSNLSTGLERLATIRDLVRDIEAAGAEVSVSFTFDLQVRYER